MQEFLKVLLAEDLERTAVPIRRYLETAGFVPTIKSADSITRFRKALESDSWNCVLTSDSLNGFGVVEAIGIIKDGGFRVPLFVLSRDSEDFQVAKAVYEQGFSPADLELPQPLERLIRKTLAAVEGSGGGIVARGNANVVLEVTRLGLRSSNLDEFLSSTGRLVRAVLPSDNFSVILRDQLSGELKYCHWDDKDTEQPHDEELAAGFAGQVIKSGQPLTVNSNNKEPDKYWMSWVGVPLKTAFRTVGVLSLGNRSADRSFDVHEVDLLSSIGDQLAAAIERRRAEAALRDSEGRYRMLFDHAPDGIIIAEASGRLLDCNAEFCRLLGYSHSEFLQKTADQIVAPSEVPQISLALDEVALRAEHHREWSFRRKDGTTFAAEVSATRMPDGNILAIVRDLSERRKAEIETAVLAAEVEVQRERLKNIVAHVPGIVWETALSADSNGQIGNFVSDYVAEMLGYSVDEWLATPDFWLSIVHPEHKERIVRSAAELGANKKTIREFPLIAKNGRVVWVEAHSAGILGPDGKIEGMRGVMIDITDRKRSELALRSSEERYRELVENAIDIIYIHDLEGNYTSINQAAERITGFSRDEILAMNMSKTIAPEYLERAKEMIAAKLAGKDVTAYEVEVLAKDGRRVALEVNTRLMYENGVPVGVQGIARDTTERRLLEEKYRQSQKMEAIGFLAGGISHDFNNLLTAISGYSEITLARMALDDPLRHHIEEIREIGQRASALTHQLLAFSRKQVLKPVVHNLNSVIGNMDKMLRRIIRENIEFQVELATELGSIEADPGQLEQVIVNLAINAQDAMPDGGRLTISTENVEFSSKDDSEASRLGIGQFVKMTVADTGEGMDEQTQERIFEPFFTTKASGKGSGLGLSTVHGIIKQSGGEILVHSTPGRGTTFDIYLPTVARDLEHSDWKPDRAEDYGGNETVLLVEDDRTVRKLVREILTHNGYEVLEASSGESALAICGDRTEPIHMLLTDLVMPQMSGIELTTKVSRLHPEAKPLVMTGYTSDSPNPRSIPNFPATFIEKPFTPEALAKKVREVLES